MEDSGRNNVEELALPQGPRSIVVGKTELVILPNIGRIPRKRIRNAYVENRPNDPRVILDTGWWKRTIWISVETPEQGDDLVASLGFAAERYGEQFFGAWGGGRLAVLLFGLAFGLSASFAGAVRIETALLATLALYAVASLLFYASRSWLTVTPEGVTFHRVLAREHFSFAEIDSIERRPGDNIVFLRKRGSPRVFVTNSDAIARVFDHVHRAFTSFVAKHPPSRVDHLLERNGRTNEAWLRDLRSLRAGDRYRVAAIDDDELRKIAYDGAQPEHLRVAAEIALKADEERDEAGELALLEALDRGDS